MPTADYKIYILNSGVYSSKVQSLFSSALKEGTKFLPYIFFKSAKKDPEKTKSRPVVVFIAVLSYNFSNIFKMFWHFWKILKLTNLFPRISLRYNFYSPLLPWRLSWRIYTPVMSLVQQLSPSKRNQSADFHHLQAVQVQRLSGWTEDLGPFGANRMPSRSQHHDQLLLTNFFNLLLYLFPHWLLHLAGLEGEGVYIL